MVTELAPSALARPCDPAALGFQTTEELPDLQDVIGQPRAIRALELGSELAGPGYNIFVLGLPGSGRTTLSLEYLQRKAASQPTPDDWVYVNNFDDPRSPRALRLPAGRGAELRRDFKSLVAYLQREMPKAFESEEYTRERDRLAEELKKSQDAELNRLQAYVEKFSFILVRTPFGLILSPGVQGKPFGPEDVEKLTPEQRAKFEELARHLSEDVEKTLERMREAARQTAEKMEDLNRRTATFLAQPAMEQLNQRYAGLPDVLTHLAAAFNDIVTHPDQFRPHDTAASSIPTGEADWLRRLEINLLVDNTSQHGAPVIIENYPSYHNLLGRVEHEVVIGATRTDFTLVRPGALHRANGGYLLVPVRDLLINPYAWEGLKRVLRDGCIRIVELASQLGLLSTETLEPEPIPLEVKLVLVGTPLLYYLLRDYDEDFAKLFKVRAEFATLMERSRASEQEYALFVRSVVADNHLLPFDASAVALVIEFSARLAEDQDKLSTRFGLVADLVREASFWADKRSDPAGNSPKGVVTAEDVRRALSERRYRDNYVEERIQELISQDTLLIDTTSSVVGQVNALSVLLLDDLGFGRPSRVTASVAPGHGGVIDIERQAQLGGPIHTKGVLILSGFLQSRFGQPYPVNLTASLAFEQSYSGIEGDSASAAELLALLSALAGIPLRQDRAITGSVNQHGEIQAIGGVNEKIEGFYHTCLKRGLTGTQGVIIPLANARHLMLHSDVVEAVQSGQFHIWPVSSIDDGIYLLTGREAGELTRRTVGSPGEFPAESFNAAVMARLVAFARTEEKFVPKDRFPHGGNPKRNKSRKR